MNAKHLPMVLMTVIQNNIDEGMSHLVPVSSMSSFVPLLEPSLSINVDTDTPALWVSMTAMMYFCKASCVMHVLFSADRTGDDQHLFMLAIEINS